MANQTVTVIGQPVPLVAQNWVTTDPVETLADTASVPSVTVTRANGTVLAAAAASTRTAIGTYSYSLTAGMCDRLDVLTATWSGVPQTDQVDVVGARYLTPATLRASDPTVFTIAKYPATGLQDLIDRTEREAERIMGTAYRGRFDVTELFITKRGWTKLPFTKVRAVRFVTASIQGVTTVYDDATIAAIRIDGRLGFIDAPSGWIGGNVTVGYEHGSRTIERALVRPMCVHARFLATQPMSGLPENTDIVAPPGASGTYRVGRATLRSCGVGWVDKIYERFGVGDADGIA